MNTEINQLTERVIGAAIEVHRELGPGLLESAYQRALAHELRLRGVAFEEQKLCPIKYKDLVIDDAYRLDFLIDGLVVVELKTVDALLDVHDAQVLTYLKFTGLKWTPKVGQRGTVPLNQKGTVTHVQQTTPA